MSDITLTVAEQRLAQYLATSRTTSNREQEVTNARRGPQSDAQTDLDGVGAELAFCRLMNVYPDLDISPRRGGGDCRWGGRVVDVKTTRYQNGRLIAVATKSDAPSDLYALMICNYPAFTFAGIATAAQLLSADRLTDLGYGPTYALDQAHLVKGVI